MTTRYNECAKLVTSSKPPQIFRLIDLRGMRDLEGMKHLNDVARVAEDFGLDDRIKEFSIKHFGVSSDQTEYSLPDDFGEIEITDPEESWRILDERDSYEDFFFCNTSRRIDEQCEYLLMLGWDLRGEDGHPLRLFEKFARPVEAGIKGIAGARLPDMDVARTENAERRLAEEAQNYLKRKRHSERRSR